MRAPRRSKDRGPPAYAAEFLGTLFLVFFITAVVSLYVVPSTPQQPTPFIDFSVIGLVHFLALFVLVQTLAVVSGAHFNPAVTIGFAVTGQLDWAVVPGYIIAQFLGAFVGAVLVWLAYLPHWGETEDEGLKLGVFCTAPAIYNAPANTFVAGFIGSPAMNMVKATIERADGGLVAR